MHLRNVSDRYDFDSVRVGIQPFISDFRGFLFHDEPLGVRLFGTRDNNRWQYNLAWFRRLEKDTNSGLNDVARAPRDDDVFVANLYRQDFPVLGFTLAGRPSVLQPQPRGRRAVLRRQRLPRAPRGARRRRAPHDYDVAYLGYNGDGHFGRWNLTVVALLRRSGDDDRHPIAQQRADIRACFAAAELSRDFSWIRAARSRRCCASATAIRSTARATGFDAILENPQFAGADTSFWIRQAVPLIGGGGVALSGRNARARRRCARRRTRASRTSSTRACALLGVGADFDLTPAAARDRQRQLAVVRRHRRRWTCCATRAAIDARSASTSRPALQYRPFFTRTSCSTPRPRCWCRAKGFEAALRRGERGAAVLGARQPDC